MIKQTEGRIRNVYFHECDVPFEAPSGFHYQYGGIVSPAADKDREGSTTGIVYNKASACWSIDVDEYACPIKFCPLCGVDLMVVEGRPA